MTGGWGRIFGYETYMIGCMLGAINIRVYKEIIVCVYMGIVYTCTSVRCQYGQVCIGSTCEYRCLMCAGGVGGRIVQVEKNSVHLAKLVCASLVCALVHAF